MYRIIYKQKSKDHLYKVWHTNDEDMILFVHSGDGSIVCNEKIYPIKPGTLCFIGAGKYHYSMPNIPEDYIRSKLFISPYHIKNLLSVIAPENNLEKTLIFAQLDDEQQREVSMLFEVIKSAEHNNYLYNLNISSVCVKLIYFLNKFSTDKLNPPSGIVEKAVEYINNNITFDIDIEKLSKEIHISKYHLCRQFKEKTGTTIMEYILKTRIILAKNMLLKENLSVSQISALCGFSSLSYFCRVFKISTGKSPLQFKKTCHKNGL